MLSKFVKEIILVVYFNGYAGLDLLSKWMLSDWQPMFLIIFRGLFLNWEYEPDQVSYLFKWCRVSEIYFLAEQILNLPPYKEWARRTKNTKIQIYSWYTCPVYYNNKRKSWAYENWNRRWRLQVHRIDMQLDLKHLSPLVYFSLIKKSIYVHHLEGIIMPWGKYFNFFLWKNSREQRSGITLN